MQTDLQVSAPQTAALLLTSYLLCLKFYLLNVLNSAWFLSERMKSFGLDFVVFRWRKFFSLSTFYFGNPIPSCWSKGWLIRWKELYSSESWPVLFSRFRREKRVWGGGRGGAESAGWVKGLSSPPDGFLRPPCLSCGLRDIIDSTPLSALCKPCCKPVSQSVAFNVPDSFSFISMCRETLRGANLSAPVAPRHVPAHLS